MIFLLLYLNWILLLESAQFEQVPHVDGHCSFTPPSLHLDFVARFDTHMQSLVNLLPFFTTLKRNGESSQELSPVGINVDGVGGVCVGGELVNGDGVGGDCVGGELVV